MSCRRPTPSSIPVLAALLLASCEVSPPEHLLSDDATAGCLTSVGAAGLTEEQALCVAEEQGLPIGIEGYDASRHEVPSLGGTVWVVKTTVYWEPHPCRKGGDALVIDASSGEVLQHNQWEQACAGAGAGPEWPGW